MTDGFQRNIRLRHLSHGNRRLDASGLAFLLKEILQSQAVHDRTEHAHVIASATIDTRLLKFGASEEIAATRHDSDLNTLLDRGHDFLRNTADHLSVDADGSPAKRLA